MTVYLAIDPGKATGVSSWNADIQTFGSHNIYDRQGVRHQVVASFLFHKHDLVVIIERWDVRKDTFAKSAQEDARYIIGWVEGFCEDEGVEYHEQTPAQAKGFATDDKLRKLGWYKAGPGHDNDAARHLLTYLVRTPDGRPLLDELTR